MALPPLHVALKPIFRSLFESRVHLDAPSILKDSHTYFTENWPWKSEAQRQSYLKNGLEQLELAALTFPDALPDRFEAVVKWYGWGFLMDDMVETMVVDEADKLKYLLEVILGRVIPDQNDRLAFITFEIHANFQSGGDERYQEFCRSILRTTAKWGKCLFSEGDARLGDKTTEECQEHRLDSVGAYAVWPTLLWAYDIPLSSQVFNDPTIRKLHNAAHLHTMLVNDLYSYRKEKAAAQKLGWTEARFCLENSVAATRRENMSSEGEAIVCIMNRVEKLEHEFEENVEDALNTYEGKVKEDIGRYANALRLVMGGNAAWSVTCNRYNSGY